MDLLEFPLFSRKSQLNTTKVSLDTFFRCIGTKDSDGEGREQSCSLEVYLNCRHYFKRKNQDEKIKHKLIEKLFIETNEYCRWDSVFN